MKKNAPLKIWENMNEILKVNNITVAYNEITKDVEIEGLDSTNLDNQLVIYTRYVLNRVEKYKDIK